MNSKGGRGRKRKVAAANKTKLYTKEGINLQTGLDQCDCLKVNCPGCFFECPKCNSRKCGITCRCNRSFSYTELVREQDDYEV